MKIKIIRIEGLGNSHSTLSFSSEYGNGQARWPEGSPIEGREYFVEIEISDKAVWGKNVIKSEKEPFSLKTENGQTIMVCEVEAIYDYGICNFRMGSSIVALEIEGAPCPVGTIVEIKTDKLVLYDMNL
ncbi:hypothetical protein KZX50_16675 [Bacillus infantis]|uniref:hypothetical protein n=1 Tax=Bacillus infantis TaxID=324767 RepID=UPI000B9A5DBC|nr:hypothetical protein [Bacillus infantis]MCK6207079.1 hypothetical protein [Bacillus infantis]OXT14580.1 hypothetical protein B9K06_25680 [Bacillus sp. OG2]